MTIPPIDINFPHFTHVELRFNDFDMLGHLNNAVFFELADLAKARFMEWMMHDVDWRHFDLAIVNINCNFYAQIFPDHNVGVFTGVRHIGNSSFTIEQRIVECPAGASHNEMFTVNDALRTYAVANTVFCAFDRKELHSKPLPANLREALSSCVVNQQ